MQYRKFGSLDWDVSALGFGCMRLPIIGDDHGQIEEKEASAMLEYAIEHGVNYVDTAYPYHKENSERFVGQFLKQSGLRDKVRLATKLPSWKIESPQDFDRYLNEQLEKLQTDHIDFYLLHALNKKNWSKLRDHGVLDWAEGAIADERIRYLGFSFHDEYDVFEEIVNAYDWTFCQIQYNYMDITNQAGTKGLKLAASKGMAVVVMEPLLGGKLVNPPEPIQAIWDSAKTQRPAAEWALQWLWNQPEVSVVLSGMSTLPQVEENIVSAGRSGVSLLTDDELGLVGQARKKYETLCPIPCTRCMYCMPCPNGVDIPRNFEVYNSGPMFDKPEAARGGYTWISEEQRASACIQCRECEDKCPQHILISEWMPIVHEVLGEGKPYDACPAPQ